MHVIMLKTIAAWFAVMKGDYFYDEPRISAIIEFVY